MRSACGAGAGGAAAVGWPVRGRPEGRGRRRGSRGARPGRGAGSPGSSPCAGRAAGPAGSRGSPPGRPGRCGGWGGSPGLGRLPGARCGPRGGWVRWRAPRVPLGSGRPGSRPAGGPVPCRGVGPVLSAPAGRGVGPVPGAGRRRPSGPRRPRSRRSAGGRKPGSAPGGPAARARRGGRARDELAPSSQRPPPTSSTRMVATTTGKKMPADPLREAGAQARRGRSELAVMDDAGRHGGQKKARAGIGKKR